MSSIRRSTCPINMSTELLGDRWTLVILRDVMFGDRRHFNVLLRENEEGITSSVLASKLQSLVTEGLLTTAEDPDHRQKIVYSLTESSIALLPVFIHLAHWAFENMDCQSALGLWFEYVKKLGPRTWQALADDLRSRHLGGPPPPAGARTFASVTANFRRLHLAGDP